MLRNPSIRSQEYGAIRPSPIVNWYLATLSDRLEFDTNRITAPDIVIAEPSSDQEPICPKSLKIER